MASLREDARWVLDDAKAGISWIAIWKTGKSWHAETMYGVEYTEGRSWPTKIESSWKIDDDDAERLRGIFEEDENAILVNPYYCNLGPWEEMTLATLMDGIRFQYGFGGDLMDILERANRRETK